MSVRRQTLILLRGTAGVGKTALWHAMRREQAHLIGVSVLQEALAAGWSWLSLGQVNELVETSDVSAGLMDAFGGKDYLVVDGCVHTEVLAAAAPLTCAVVRLWCFARPWLIEARRRSRVSQPGPAYDCELAEYIVQSQHVMPYVRDIFVDTSEYPVRRITQETALSMMQPAERSSVELTEIAKQYQQCLRIDGEWHGSTDSARQEFEQERLERILPADMAGATVLDIGASDGGFCYEAFNRGAIYATACEVDAGRCALMRYVRDARQLPLTVAEINAVGPTLPRRYNNEDDALYDYGLLLNVLHHCDDPAPLLREVMGCCQRVTVETPFATGLKPVRLADGPYPNALCLPPAWVEAVAGGFGFDVAGIRVSNMAAGSRLIYELHRRT